ncbi:hypothetical protein [Hymenobacter sp. BT491]|uniref:hypothetical protein n=1 Tax=Hymenobacter sp. BT491 TaxID=2766779 RepID=UPI001653B6E9|nr:hypothetical protein [Hymenobacter sp. BT491]MBC6990532.1 hypothetical protein [Hymenobacter sp. BT491]
MLTWRTFLLTATGLLTGYVAAAQTPATSASAASSTQGMLFWFVVGILGLVLLVVLLASAMITVQLRPHLDPEQDAEPTILHPQSTTAE